MATERSTHGGGYTLYSIPELRQLFAVGEKYPRFADLNKYVFKPTLTEINDYGTVTVKTTQTKLGQLVSDVRFDWEWKSIVVARVADEENQRHVSARHKISDGSGRLEGVGERTWRHLQPESKLGEIKRLTTFNWGLSAPKPPKIFAEQYGKRYQSNTSQAEKPLAVNSMAVNPCDWPFLKGIMMKTIKEIFFGVKKEEAPYGYRTKENGDVEPRPSPEREQKEQETHRAINGTGLYWPDGRLKK